MRSIATRIDDIAGRGESDPPLKVRRYLDTRFGKLKVQGKYFVRVGMGMAHCGCSPPTSCREDLTENPTFLPTAPKLRAGLKEPQSIDATKMRQ